MTKSLFNMQRIIICATWLCYYGTGCNFKISLANRRRTECAHTRVRKTSVQGCRIGQPRRTRRRKTEHTNLTTTGPHGLVWLKRNWNSPHHFDRQGLQQIFKLHFSRYLFLLLTFNGRFHYF